jgi:hypothetical protein
LVDLMDELRRFFTARITTVENAITEGKRRQPFPQYSTDVAKADYETFLEIISACIGKLPEVYSEPVAPLPPVPSSPSGSTKRDRTGDEPTPPAKRSALTNPTWGTMSSTEEPSSSRRARRGKQTNSYREASDSEGERPPSPSPLDRKGKGKKDDNGTWTPGARFHNFSLQLGLQCGTSYGHCPEILS